MSIPTLMTMGVNDVSKRELTVNWTRITAMGTCASFIDQGAEDTLKAIP